MEEQVVQTNPKASKRSFVGIVTSDKMDKTIVVSVTTKKLHRLYKNVECRPLSREKCWRLAEIIERAK